MNKPVSRRRRHPAARSTGPTKGRRQAVPVGEAAPAEQSGPRHHPVRARLVDGVAADLRPAGAGAARVPAMDYFAARGFDTWCVDMEGYGRSTKDPRQQRADLLRRRRLLHGRDRLHLQDCAASARCWSTASRRARCARRCSRSAIRTWSRGSRSTPMVWTGEGSPTLVERSKRLPEFLAKNRRPIDRKFVRSIFERDHPGTADDHVIEAFADAHPRARQLDPERHICRHVREPAGGRSRPRSWCRPSIMRGEYDGIAGFERPDEVLREAAQSGQAVRGDAGHRACLVPAEELHDRVSHPAELLHPAGADLQERALMSSPARDTVRSAPRDAQRRLDCPPARTVTNGRTLDRSRDHSIREEASCSNSGGRCAPRLSSSRRAPLRPVRRTPSTRPKPRPKARWSGTPRRRIAQGQKIVDVFEKEHGIKVEMFRSGGSAILRRFQQEMDAGRIAADVLTTPIRRPPTRSARREPSSPFKPKNFDKVPGRRQGQERQVRRPAAEPDDELPALRQGRRPPTSRRAGTTFSTPNTRASW